MSTDHLIRRRMLQVVGGLSILGASFVAVVGVAHTDFGRPLLRYIPGMGACPLDAAALTAEERMRVRGEQLAAVAGEGAAPSRAVLAFELGVTTRADLDQWAVTHDLVCAPSRSMSLRCDGVPAAALGGTGFDELSFELSPRDVLLAVEGSATVADADGAAKWIARRDELLRGALGEPTQTRGDAVAGDVSRGPLSTILASTGAATCDLG